MGNVAKAGSSDNIFPANAEMVITNDEPLMASAWQITRTMTFRRVSVPPAGAAVSIEFDIVTFIPTA